MSTNESATFRCPECKRQNRVMADETTSIECSHCGWTELDEDNALWSGADEDLSDPDEDKED